jgi:hypothetical protein
MLNSALAQIETALLLVFLASMIAFSKDTNRVIFIIYDGSAEGRNKQNHQ